MTDERSPATDDESRTTDGLNLGIGTYDVDPDRCEAAVATALACGYRHVDTAEMYDTETAVGRALERADVPRESVVVATKIHSQNLEYDSVIEHARACRDRLGLDAIDLLYVHWPIRSYDPTETLAAFDELYDRGAIRNVGVSNFRPAQLETAIDILEAPLFAHQVECHPLLPQDELRRLARAYDHHLVGYSPLAKGRVLELAELDEIASAYDATPAQISLAWLEAKGVVPIPKSTSEAHIRENIAARSIELDRDDVDRIDRIDRTERVVDFPDAPWN
ncbi:aldo/keto reductase [Halovivax gelatinilyticus]|uniref:aldo/keto reductase n=1 Tax=Halovivax gelatinilyticus TaxID=2961597 RepID=UPI0020CA3F96|nr:aldo/keto reductase [Halovivax gelatinilyticus]